MMKKVKSQNTVLLIILLICAILNSCVSTRNVANKTSEIEAKPKLVFINYLIKNNLSDDKTKSIRCINTIVTDGTLKNNSKHLKEGDLGDLNCRQLDKNSNVLQSVIIKNPLIKTFEYTDESNKFHLKTVALDSAEFSLKLKLEPRATHITISEISNVEYNENQLIKTQLKL